MEKMQEELPKGWEETFVNGKPFYQYYVNKSGWPWPHYPGDKKNHRKIVKGRHRRPSSKKCSVDLRQYIKRCDERLKIEEGQKKDGRIKTRIKACQDTKCDGNKRNYDIREAANWRPGACLSCAAVNCCRFCARKKWDLRDDVKHFMWKIKRRRPATYKTIVAPCMTEDVSTWQTHRNKVKEMVIPKGYEEAMDENGDATGKYHYYEDKDNKPADERDPNRQCTKTVSEKPAWPPLNPDR